MHPPGTRLGPYELSALVGEGGMGEVYRARDTRLDRTVAIKILKTEFSNRFEREARAISALNHPHICSLHDVGQDGETEYLVMEYVQGKPLACPMEVRQAIEFGVQIADALAAAHRQGIIHRDLKPANILVTREGVKLLDFGIASIQPQIAAVDQGVTASRTIEGVLVGTLEYMAPEQLEGRKADERTDIYAFGLVLYEMLTGLRAAEASSAAGVIAVVMSGPIPSVRTRRPDVPEELERLIHRCLEKDPDRRWQSAEALREALQWLRDSRGRTTSTGGLEQFASAALLALTVGQGKTYSCWRRAACAGAGWLAASLSHRAPAGLSMVTDLDLPPDLTSGSTRCLPSLPTASPWCSIPAERCGFGRCRMAPSGDSPERRAASSHSGPLPVEPLRSSPTDNCSASTCQMDRPSFWPRRRPPGGSVELSRCHGIRSVTWGAVAASRRGWWCHVRGHRTRLVATGGDTRVPELRSRRRPLRVLRGQPGSPVVDRQNGRPRQSWWPRAAHQPTAIPEPAVVADTPEGTYLLSVRDGELVAQSFDVSRGRVSGPARTLARRVRPQFSVMSNGAIVYVVDPDVRNQPVWVERDGRTIGPDGEIGSYQDLGLSRDQTKVAYVGAAEAGGVRGVWVRDLTTGSTTRLRIDGVPDDPIWSPDGRQLAIALKVEGEREERRVHHRSGAAGSASATSRHSRCPLAARLVP